MPYIAATDRDKVLKKGATTAGELNYALTKLIKNYLGTDFNYQRLNDCIGALEGCKLELYARIVRPYEDKKIKSNGDVF